MDAQHERDDVSRLSLSYLRWLFFALVIAVAILFVQLVMLVRVADHVNRLERYVVPAASAARR